MVDTLKSLIIATLFNIICFINIGAAMPQQNERIILGGGCFWCTEAAYKVLKGVTSITPGYSGGWIDNPTYTQVSLGTTGHAEVIDLHFDANVTSLGEVLDIFFNIHDPTTLNKQGADTGTQYRSAIFFFRDEQEALIQKKIELLNSSGKWSSPIVTEVKRATKFYPAEEYHHDYFAKNPNQPYCLAVVAPKVEKVKEMIGNKHVD